MNFDCREPDDEFSGADKPVIIQNLFSHVINDQGRAFSEPINYNSFLYIFWRARVATLCLCRPFFMHIKENALVQISYEKTPSSREGVWQRKQQTLQGK